MIIIGIIVELKINLHIAFYYKTNCKKKKQIMILFGIIFEIYIMNTDKLVGTVLISEKVVMYTKQTFMKINIPHLT